MTTATLQTPLEVILFFTSLASHGVRYQSFQAISDILKADRDVRESEGYDEARLSPESLQQLYLALLKDEVRQQAQRKKSPSPVAQENGSPNSRKRKVSSPVLSSLQDAQEHEHLLPILVDKLYARYREQALQDIAKEEEIYRTTQEDIAKISQEGVKERVNGDDPTKHKRTPSISSMLRDDGPTAAQPTSYASRPPEGQATAGPPIAIPDQYKKPKVAPSPVSTPVTAANPYRKQELAASSPRPPPSAAGPGGQPYASNAYSRPGSAARPDSTRPSLPQISAHPTPGQTSSYSGRPQPISVPNAASPHPQHQSPHMHADRSSQSPRIVLPPPPGPGRGYTSPTAPAQSPQYRPGQPAQNAMQMQQQQQVIHPHTVPRPSHYQQPGYQFQAQRGVYPQHAQYPQQAQSYQGTPQQVTPYGAQPYPHSAQPQVQGQNVPYQQSATRPGQQSYPNTPAQALPFQGKHPYATPGSVARRMLPKLDTSTPSTKWKSTGPKRDKSPVAPPLSPMDMGSPTYGLLPEADDTTKIGSRKGGKPALGHGALEAEDTPTRPAGRGRAGRGGRGGRGGQAASTRTRSQSVASQTDEPAKPKAKPGKVKPEPGTPMDESSPGVPNSDAGTPLPSGLARRRGNTLRSIETPPVLPRPGQKRKRANTLEVGSPSSPAPATPKFPALPTRPGYILGVRNMPRIAATILNDVTTHKLASMFQKPISEREAPGYRDVVFQPQDLKTIRSQLQAGQKAIIAADAAAQDAGGDVGTPSGAAGVSKATSTIWLERSPEVMPPKAIVNSSQLETEICRIFANAVMFNPDPKRGVGPAFRTRAKRAEAIRQSKDVDDEEEEESEGDDMSGGVVNDAREMFSDVERQLAAWRAAERTSVGGGTMGLDGANDDGQPMEDPMDEEKDEGPEGDDSRSTRRRK